MVLVLPQVYLYRTRGTDLALTGECHVESEGSEGESANYYGGDNDADALAVWNMFGPCILVQKWLLE